MKVNRFVTVLLALLMAIPLMPAFGDEGGAAGRIADNDNDFANATEAGSGNPYPGNLSSADDTADFFWINAPVGKVLNATLFVNGYPGIKAKLVAYDAAGIFKEESNSGTQWEAVCILAEKSSRYYFSVNLTSGVLGDYTFTVTLKDPTTIQMGNTIPGYVNRPGNSTSDWYVFTMNGDINGGLNNDVATFTLFKDLSLTMDVWFYNLWPEFFLVAFNISLNHASGANITAAATFSGPYYYLRVVARTGSGNYNVTLHNFDSELSDNNHNVGPAIRLSNTPYTTTIDMAFDNYDWYKLFLLNTEMLDLTLTLNTYTPGKYQIWAFTFENNIYTPLFNVSNFNSTTGAWTNTIHVIYQPAISCRYYLIPMAVHGLDAQGKLSSSPAIANYTLTLTSPNPSNHPPMLRNPVGSPSILEDSSQNPIFNLNDVFWEADGDGMWFNVTGSEHLNASLSLDGFSVVKVTPVKDWVGVEEIAICATDSYSVTTIVMVPIQVFNTPDRPVVVRQLPNVTFNEDYSAELNISGAFWDADIPYGDSLRIVWVGNASIPMYLDNDTMVVTFGPVVSYYGERDVTFRAFDNGGYLAAQKIRVTVVHTNHPPALKGADRLDISMDEDTVNRSFSAIDFFTDRDTFYAGDVLSYSGNSSAHLNCTVDKEGKIVIAPVKDWYGSESCYVVATDKGNDAVALQVAVVVSPVNDPPEIAAFQPNASEVAINETETVTFSIAAADADTPLVNLKYAWFVDGNKTGSVGPSYTFTTDLNSSGKHVIMATVSDGEFTTSYCWTVPVFNKNQPPVAGIISPKNGQVFPEGTMILFRCDAVDPEMDKLTYTWKEGNATLGNTRTLNWKFPPGNHTATIIVGDGTDTTVLNVTVFVDSVPSIDIQSPKDRSRYKTTDAIKFIAIAFDRDGEPVTGEWREGSKVLSRTVNFTKKLGAGTHYLTLNVTNARGGNETQIVIVVEQAGGAGFIPGFEAPLALAVVSSAALVLSARRRWRRG